MSVMPNDGLADHLAERAIAETAKDVVWACIDPHGHQPDSARRAMAIQAARDVAAAIREGYAAYHGTREEADRG